MNIHKLLGTMVIGVLFAGSAVEAKDYRHKLVGDFSDASTDISASESNGTFLTFMKETLYPVIKSQAPFQTTYARPHLDDIAEGIGAELRLAPDVTTYHVKYAGPWQEKADQSGRSFGVVNDGPILAQQEVDYIADASYSFYLRELEKVLVDKHQAKLFYQAIFKVIIKADSSGFLVPDLDYYTKRVAADFVAVYVAEQYRRLLKYDGRYVNYSSQDMAKNKWKKFARRKPWDDAHLQTTLLANFHGGQTQPGMFFAGVYMTQTYPQKATIDGLDICAYEILTNSNSDDDELVDGVRTRNFRLNDYWQFGLECGGRSGVNITRNDFTKLGYEITQWLNDHGHRGDLNKIWILSEKTVGTRRNLFDEIANKIISDKAPKSFAQADELIAALVDFVMLAREKADLISAEL